MVDEKSDFLPDVLQLAVKIRNRLIFVDRVGHFLNLKIFPFRHDRRAVSSELVGLARCEELIHMRSLSGLHEFFSASCSRTYANFKQAYRHFGKPPKILCNHKSDQGVFTRIQLVLYIVQNVGASNFIIERLYCDLISVAILQLWENAKYDL